jgi:serine/threonine protein kinase
MTCANCQAAIPAGATFCPECGTKAAPVVATSGANPRRSGTPGGTFSGLGTVAPMREAPTSVLENGSLFANRYEVLRKIGEGGMGVVYLTRDANSGDEVVLKLIHPDLVADEAMKRLMAEGLTARRINHPCVVGVFDVTKWEGQPYFTMEHVKGGSLRTWLVKQTRDGTSVPLATAIGIVKAILAGLGEAHRMDVVHRDLKPENVLLVKDPSAGEFSLKIVDFGIARAISGPLATNRPSGPVGTQHYMAPEQNTSAEVAGPAADFYSVTMMLYELLIGVLPQARYEAVSTLRPEIPMALDAVIDKGMRAMASGRYSSAAAYAAALDALPAQTAPAPTPDPDPVPQPPPPPPPPPPGTGWWARTQARWAALSTMTKAGLVGGVIVMGIIANFEDPSPRPPDRVVGPNGPNSRGDDDVTPKPPPPQTPVAQWSDDHGNSFSVTSSEPRSFEGTGALGGLRGTVTIEGELGQGFWALTVVDSGGTTQREGRGGFVDQGHFNYTWQDARGAVTNGQFHINHAH